MKGRFKSVHSVESRWREANNILLKYSDRVPVICERSTSAPKDCPEIDKNKYIVPRDLTIAQFHFYIRKKMNIPAEKGLFLFINDIIPHSSELIGDTYEFHKDPDCFLYVSYSYENVFG